MKRGVIIIIIGILLLIVTGAVYMAFTSGLIGGGASTPAPVAAPADGDGETGEQPADKATPIPEYAEIVIAVQDIPRGKVITADAVAIWDWPLPAIPPESNLILGSVKDDYNGDGVPDAIEGILGMRARNDIARFEPIQNTMLANDIDLRGTGSDAALALDPGRVLIAFPLPTIEEDPTTAIAYALRAGDHVDLMISLALVDLDEEFHTKLPNQTQQLNITQTEEGDQEVTLTEFPYGRIEEGPLGLIFNVIPGEIDQRARLVTQMTVQDAIVVRVGRFPTHEEEVRGIDPQAPPTPTPVPEEGAEEQAPSAPPPPPKPEVIVLAVTPQEALVIKFAREIHADIDFAARAVGDQALFQTNPVTLQYLMETYNIAVPPKLQYGIEPPIYELEQLTTTGGEQEE